MERRRSSRHRQQSNEYRDSSDESGESQSKSSSSSPSPQRAKKTRRSGNQVSTPLRLSFDYNTHNLNQKEAKRETSESKSESPRTSRSRSVESTKSSQRERKKRRLSINENEITTTFEFDDRTGTRRSARLSTVQQYSRYFDGKSNKSEEESSGSGSHSSDAGSRGESDGDSSGSSEENSPEEKSPPKKEKKRKRETENLQSSLKFKCDVEASKNADLPSSESSHDDCYICGDGGNLVMCDGCPKGYHIRCLDPPRKSIPPGDWKCDHCDSDGEPPEFSGNKNKKSEAKKVVPSRGRGRRRTRRKKNDDYSSEPDNKDPTESESSEESQPGKNARVRRSNRPVKEISRFNPSTFRSQNNNNNNNNNAKRHTRRPNYLSSSTSSDSEEYARQTRMVEANMIPLNDPERNLRADVSPVEIDQSVDWSKVGGLDQHINSLKEMVMFPLMYPELFARFNVNPPKGVLFYGPPGTGKTLVARALANTCSKNGRKVSFFMRKGADILSKWVGEAERQLRLLFEQAKRMEPSIIFFDEIDGLAPVRSSRQDQIHSSIVSTLLALMDGLDNRGQVVVIGATNRIDHIDPGLRRPGRFDSSYLFDFLQEREFLFTLPSASARKSILDIHTKTWEPPLSDQFKDIIAEKCVGYCGADVKALCTEASLRAIRRHYPQIYESEEKLLIHPEKIVIQLGDFINAMTSIVPSSHRSSISYSRSLLIQLKPLLGFISDALFKKFGTIMGGLEKPGTESKQNDFLDVDTDIELSIQSIQSRFMSTIYRPRLLICADKGMGQAEIVADLLHRVEHFPIHSIDMASLHSDPTLSMEDCLISRFKEALLKLPCIIFLPHIDSWWEHAKDELKQTFTNILADIDPTLPLFFLAVSDVPNPTQEILNLFDNARIFTMPKPTDAHLKQFWNMLKTQVTIKPNSKRRKVYPKLRPAPILEIPEKIDPLRSASDVYYQRKLRESLRNMLIRVRKNRRFDVFHKNINEKTFADYFTKINDPIDLNTISNRIDSNYYTKFADFMEDITLMTTNAKSYFTQNQKQIINKASELDDYMCSLMRRVDQRLIDSVKDSSRRNVRGPKIAFENPKEEVTKKSKGKDKSKKSNKDIKIEDETEPQSHDSNQRELRKSTRQSRTETRSLSPKAKEGGLDGDYWNTIVTKDDAIEEKNNSEVEEGSEQAHGSNVDSELESDGMHVDEIQTEMQSPMQITNKPQTRNNNNNTTPNTIIIMDSPKKQTVPESKLSKQIETVAPLIDLREMNDPEENRQNQENLMGEDENLMDEQEEEEIYREIEEESPNFELVVNAKDLDILFDKIVSKTSFVQSRLGINIEKILSLHVSLMNNISEEFDNPNKKVLLEKMANSLLQWEKTYTNQVQPNNFFNH